MSVDCCVQEHLNIIGGDGHRNAYYVSRGVGEPRETGKLDHSCLFQNESRWSGVLLLVLQQSRL